MIKVEHFRNAYFAACCKEQLSRGPVFRYLFTSYVRGTDGFMLKRVLFLFGSLKPQFFSVLCFTANLFLRHNT